MNLKEKIRKLIFRIVTESYGSKWFIDTVSEELQSQIKSKSNINTNKLVENALYEMTMRQLEDYLFLKWRAIDAEKFMESDIAIENIAEMSKEDILAIIKENQSKSLWDRIFDDRVEIIDLQLKLETVRKCRNTVAHSKLISAEEFEVNISLIKKLIREIDRALLFADKNEEFSYNLTSAFRSVTQSMEIISQATAPIREFSARMNEATAPIREFSARMDEATAPIRELSTRMNEIIPNVLTDDFYKVHTKIVNKIDNSYEPDSNTNNCEGEEDEF